MPWYFIPICNFISIFCTGMAGFYCGKIFGGREIRVVMRAEMDKELKESLQRILPAIESPAGTQILLDIKPGGILSAEKVEPAETTKH